jgi:hypothetical protein
VRITDGMKEPIETLVRSLIGSDEVNFFVDELTDIVIEHKEDLPTDDNQSLVDVARELLTSVNLTERVMEVFKKKIGGKLK